MSEFKNTCVLVSMYDKVTGQYSTPLAFDNIDCAKRWFTFYLKKADLMAEPSDFELYYLGQYKCYNGKIECPDNMEFLMKGVVLDE